MSIKNAIRTTLALLVGALAVSSANAGNGDLVFTLHNNSSFVVVEVYASPNDVNEWEDDILGQDVLGSEEAVRITIADAREQCEYDLRFVFDDGDVLERPSVDLCETEEYTLTD